MPSPVKSVYKLHVQDCAWRCQPVLMISPEPFNVIPYTLSPIYTLQDLVQDWQYRFSLMLPDGAPRFSTHLNVSQHSLFQFINYCLVTKFLA